MLIDSAIVFDLQLSLVRRSSFLTGRFIYTSGDWNLPIDLHVLRTLSCRLLLFARPGKKTSMHICNTIRKGLNVRTVQFSIIYHSFVGFNYMRVTDPHMSAHAISVSDSNLSFSSFSFWSLVQVNPGWGGLPVCWKALLCPDIDSDLIHRPTTVIPTNSKYNSRYSCGLGLTSRR
jgi:hypothetical protein